MVTVLGGGDATSILLVGAGGVGVATGAGGDATSILLLGAAGGVTAGEDEETTLLSGVTGVGVAVAAGGATSMLLLGVELTTFVSVGSVLIVLGGASGSIAIDLGSFAFSIVL